MSSAATSSTTALIGGVTSVLLLGVAFLLGRSTAAVSSASAPPTTQSASTQSSLASQSVAQTQTQDAVAAAPVAPAASSSAAAASSSSSSSSSSDEQTPADKARRSRSSKKQWDKEKLKMVLVVRKDLGQIAGMGAGKIIAQSCHAAVGVTMMLLKTDAGLVESWDQSGAMKIAVKVNSEQELIDLEKRADELKLPNYLVVDAGHTQIAPDSKTVLAIGPAKLADIDKLTGGLKLM